MEIIKASYFEDSILPHKEEYYIDRETAEKRITPSRWDEVHFTEITVIEK